MAEKQPGYQTKQKARILSYFEMHPDRHFTAAELVQAMQNDGTPIGAATVYRQLERLEQGGLLRRYALDERGSACWQYAMHREHCTTHFHLKCTACGMLLHTDCEFLRNIDTHILAHHGFCVDHSRTVLYGLCEQCQQQAASDVE